MHLESQNIKEVTGAATMDIAKKQTKNAQEPNPDIQSFSWGRKGNPVICIQNYNALANENIQPTPVQWAVRKGGGLTYGDSPNSSSNINNG